MRAYHVLLCCFVWKTTQSLQTYSSFQKYGSNRYLSKSATRFFRENIFQNLHSSYEYSQSCLHGTQNSDREGCISLVGAGPGDPDLLTVAAIKELNKADIVISDRLVSRAITEQIRCAVKVAKKKPGCAEEAQEEIYRWCKEALDQGKYVVRLKIGDPLIFGRGGEEMLRFRSWGYEPKIVPGVSAILSAPLLGSIPLTHRGVANRIVIGTGYGQNDTTTDISPYHPEQTAVFLMAVGRLASLCEDLKEHGYPDDCPVGIIENASTERQRVIVGNIQNIPELAQKFNVQPPSTIVFGWAVKVLHGDSFGLVSDFQLNGVEHSKEELFIGTEM